MQKYCVGAHRVHHLIWLVVTLLILLGSLFLNVYGGAYGSFFMEPVSTITLPPVVLQNGMAGTSTIYMNSTSARVSVSGYGYDFVDNNNTDVDSSADRGTHGNFTAQKYGPDLINDTLAEEGTGGTSDVFTDGFEDQTFNKWDDNEATAWQIVNTEAHGGTYSAESQSTHQGELISDDIDLSGATSAGFECWAYATAVDSNEFLLYFYNGTAYNLITDLDVVDDVWNYHSYVIDSQYYVSNFRIRFYTTGLGVPQDVYVDDVNVNKTIMNYELDLEVQWTSLDFDETYEELCIKTGTFSGSEDIRVYAWNVPTSNWHFLYNLTASAWNNVSVTDWLNNENFTIQFLGGTENNDTNQDSWNIDATLLHLWTENYDYVLRVNNTVTDSWQIRLKKYSDSNINRLQNCTIYFHNSTDGTSSQICIENSAYTQDTGTWYNLPSLATIYIAITVVTNSTGTSHVYSYLEILTPDTSTYSQYIVTFEIT